MMERRKFINSVSLVGAGLSLTGLNSSSKSERSPVKNTNKSPLAITMWEFSWLERRWPGAGYEDWDTALSELKERGYNAVRIDAFPHLIHNDPNKEYLIRPHWSTQDWGSPAINKIQVQPYFIDFIRKCESYGIKIGLSTWWREDEGRSFDIIQSPEKLAEVWLSVLDLIKEHNLLHQIVFLDVSNEWTLDVWTPFKTDFGSWDTKESTRWMRETIAVLRSAYPEIPYTFSITEAVTAETISKGDLSMLDFIEIHIWMVGSYDMEFYEKVGYQFERFSYEGYDNLALKGEKLYRENENYWKEGLQKQIEYAALWSKKTKLPLVTTECWGVIDYKDWPLLSWDWVKELCEFGTLEALKTGQWAGIATSNFCGPQFKGMWRDTAWHQRLAKEIKSYNLPKNINDTLLVGRF